MLAKFSNTEERRKSVRLLDFFFSFFFFWHDYYAVFPKQPETNFLFKHEIR